MQQLSFVQTQASLAESRLNTVEATVRATEEDVRSLGGGAAFAGLRDRMAAAERGLRQLDGTGLVERHETLATHADVRELVRDAIPPSPSPGMTVEEVRAVAAAEWQRQSAAIATRAELLEMGEGLQRALPPPGVGVEEVCCDGVV